MTETKWVMQGVVDTDIQKRLRVTASRDIVRNVPGIVLSRRDACRDVFVFTFRNGYDIAPSLARIALSGRYDSYSRVYRVIVPNMRGIGECWMFTVPIRFEVERERIPGQLYNRFDLSVYRRDSAVSSHDLIRFSTGSGGRSNCYDLWPIRPDLCRNRHDAITEFPSGRLFGRFSSSLGNIRVHQPCRWGILRYSVTDRVAGRYAQNTSFSGRVPDRFDAIFSRTDMVGLMPLLATGRFDAIRNRICRHPGRYDLIVTLQPQGRYYGLYAACGRARDARRWNRQAFVRAGWRIIVKNIETGEIVDLGFIDADATDRSVEGVLLADGDYEIMVKTSSLFWADASERDVRTLTIRDGVPVVSLPSIYNLRSSTFEGSTTLRWSATGSGVADCVFGVWYSAASPVDVNRVPDTTIWYSPNMSEYQTTLERSGPAWVAVAVVRTGDDTEMGKVHTLFLDWNTAPPQAPSDVTVLDGRLIETEHGLV